MTLSDYRALKAGLEEIADLTDKIRLINEGEVKEIQRRIAIKDTEISDLKSDINIEKRRLKKTLEPRKRTLEAAFREKYPDIPLTEENVFERNMQYHHELENGNWRFRPPDEIPHRAYLMESRFFISIFIGSLFLLILFLTGTGIEWRPDFLNYQCDSGETIDVWRVGNGVENCSDGSDEGNIQYIDFYELDYLSIYGIFSIWFLLDVGLLSFAYLANIKSHLTRKDESEFGARTVYWREWYKSHYEPDYLPTTFVDILCGIWSGLYISSWAKKYHLMEEESKISEELSEVYMEIHTCVLEQERMSRKLELLIGESEPIESELSIPNAKIEDLIGAIAEVNKTIAHLIPS